jgi:hypothetical protein
MRINRAVILLFLSTSFLTGVYGTSPNNLVITAGLSARQNDSLAKQILYNGRVWRNLYIRIEGDPFFLTDKFSPGTVIINNSSFRDIRIRYDIYNDEIMILTDHEIILKLNKEMISSFSIVFNGDTCKFTKLEISDMYPVSGYVNLLYNGDLSLLVKYRKEIDTSTSNRVYGTFFQSHRIYVLKDTIMYPVGGRRSLFKLLEDKKQEIRVFMKTNKIKVAKKHPDSFVPVLEFYDETK